VNGPERPPDGAPLPAPSPVAPGESGPAVDAPPEVPLTPGQWLARNGVYLAIIIVGLVWLYRAQGWEGLPSAFLTIFGIGFIIFIHELGHFLVAKWCDVHVLTFSIGFGPAIPGCSFKRGETTYKIALLPLGGYVNMVGEGTDAEEDEDYPRSFKNKTVGQRMAIISAGVIMNVILGAICFIFVYRTHGVERTRAIVGVVDPGGVAWAEGLRSGEKVVQIDDNKNPNFEDLKATVTLSSKGKPVVFHLLDPAHPDRERDLKLEPRRGEGQMSPMIGVAPQTRLELRDPEYRKYQARPYQRNSAAAAARVVDLKPGDVVVSATDPDDASKRTPLKANSTTAGWLGELTDRMRRLAGEPMTLEVRRKGRTESDTVELPAEGFELGDASVGTSDLPASRKPAGYDPLQVVELPRDPRIEDSDQRDPFVFRHRMRLLAGEPVLMQVKRYRSDKTVNVLVPPAFHVITGMRMKMGPVLAVREGSPAEAVGVKSRENPNDRGDEISAVRMTDAAGKVLLNIGDPPRDQPIQGPAALPLDPVRLPSQLARAAMHNPGKKLVILTVVRVNPKNRETEPVALDPAVWDESFDDSVEVPLGLSSPLSIPQLGLAYGINSLVGAVEERSPAAEARKVVKDRDGVWTKEPDPIRPFDVVTGIRFWSAAPGESGWDQEFELQSKPRDVNHVDYRWASTFEYMQRVERRVVQLKIRRSEQVLDEPFELVLREDRTWPTVDRGLQFSEDFHLVKAENLLQALEFGSVETWRFILNIYQGLRSVAQGRVSTRTFGGPGKIVSMTFRLAKTDYYQLILFLGVLSINLAVVNFLPIPLLDGGHMVFLIYEKIRGKPASEQVRGVAAYIGLAMLLALMTYVILLDIGWI
jgi:RIP metalloprotease RseP